MINILLLINGFNKFSDTIFDERLKQGKLATNKDFGIAEEHAIKNEEKIEKLPTFDSSFFYWSEFFG